MTARRVQNLDHLAATKLDLNTYEALRQSAHRRGVTFGAELRRRLMASLVSDPVPEQLTADGE